MWNGKEGVGPGGKKRLGGRGVKSQSKPQSISEGSMAGVMWTWHATADT